MTIQRPVARTRAAAACLLGLTLACGAPTQTPKPDATIVVHPNRLVWSAVVFDDLDLLEAEVAPRAPQYVGIHVCGADAARVAEAVAHRFRFLYLDLRFFAPPECASASATRTRPVSERPSPRVAGIDTATVEAWWRQTMP
jgi:hypothetical protein